MTTVNEKGVTVVYPEQQNSKRARQINFNGNFGFDIDGKKYTAKNGKLYDTKGNEVYVLELSKQTAYQFIGMSNNEYNNKDYTYFIVLIF